MTSGRGIIADATMCGIVQTDDAQVGHLTLSDHAGGIDPADIAPLAIVKELRCCCNGGLWLWTRADSAEEADARDEDDWWQVLPNVEVAFPVDEAHTKYFFKVSAGMAVLKWHALGFVAHTHE